jgi:hypothetical protein
MKKIKIIKPSGYTVTEYTDEAGNQTFTFHCNKIGTGELVREATSEDVGGSE